MKTDPFCVYFESLCVHIDRDFIFLLLHLCPKPASPKKVSPEGCPIMTDKESECSDHTTFIYSSENTSTTMREDSHRFRSGGLRELSLVVDGFDNPSGIEVTTSCKKAAEY